MDFEWFQVIISGYSLKYQGYYITVEVIKYMQQSKKIFSSILEIAQKMILDL
jgi:hypothetical protein